MQSLHGQSLRSRKYRDGLAIHETAYAPGLLLQEHAHSQHLLSLVVRGGLEDHCRRRDHAICRDEFFISAAGEKHRTRFNSRGAIVLNVLVDDSWMAFNAPGHAPAPFYGRKDRTAFIARELYDEFSVDDDVSELGIVGAVLQLLAASTRLRATSARPLWVSRVVERILDNPADTPDIDALAAQAGVHRSTLCAGFRRSTGMTVGQYARASRLRRARDFLVDRGRPIAWIAFECGFADQAHFSRSFRKAFGVTPSEFRKQRHLD